MDVLVLGMVLLVLVFGAKDSILKAILGGKKKKYHTSVLKTKIKSFIKALEKSVPLPLLWGKFIYAHFILYFICF